MQFLFLFLTWSLQILSARRPKLQRDKATTGSEGLRFVRERLKQHTKRYYGHCLLSQVFPPTCYFGFSFSSEGKSPDRWHSFSPPHFSYRSLSASGSLFYRWTWIILQDTLTQCFLNLGCIILTGELVKIDLWGPDPELVIQQTWGGAPKSAFLTSSLWDAEAADSGTSLWELPL